MNAPAPTPALADLIDLTGRTAVVTGGAVGIGRAIVQRLHEAGADVVVADLDAAASDALVADLDRARRGSALAVRTDVADADDVDALFAATAQRFGGVDVLVNNAGIYPILPFVDTDADAFLRVLRVNLLGPYLTMRAATAQMIARGRGGRIINVTSIDALHPSMVGLAPYDASKHGLWGLTKNVALELAAHGIAVNALAPGSITTPGTGGVEAAAAADMNARIPMHRPGDPDEMGRVALFLASDLSSYLTGSQIVADGGVLLR